MKRLLVAVLILLSSPAFGVAGMVFDVVPSSQTSNVNGLEFSPGHDFVVTNTLVQQVGGPDIPLWMDFRVVYDSRDGDGNVFFRPDNDAFQVYVLDHTIPSQSRVSLVRTFVAGESEVHNLGGGRYDYKADVVGGNIDLVFNTNLPAGHQVESGVLNFDAGSVPEPSSLILSVLGVVGSATYYRLRRNITNANNN